MNKKYATIWTILIIFALTGCRFHGAETPHAASFLPNAKRMCPLKILPPPPNYKLSDWYCSATPYFLQEVRSRKRREFRDIVEGCCIYTPGDQACKIRIFLEAGGVYGNVVNSPQGNGYGDFKLYEGASLQVIDVNGKKKNFPGPMTGTVAKFVPGDPVGTQGLVSVALWPRRLSPSVAKKLT